MPHWISVAPSFIVFANLADKAYPQADLRTEEAAKAYATKVGVIALADQIGAEVLIMRPNGASWAAADVENAIFVEYKARGNLQNLRVLGFGDGATFVGDHLTEREPIRRVAGVFMYGRDMTAVRPDSQ
jgi:hypothetical protein